MADAIEKVSPLHALAEPGRFGDTSGEPGVGLSERLCDSLVQVQAWPDSISALKKAVKSVTGASIKPGNAVATKGDVVLMSTGPGRWLVEDETDDLEVRLRKAIGADIGAVTALTHARTVVSISGERCEWVLASGIALDFSADAFPVGTAKLSHHHEIGLTIHRTGDQAFDLYVVTSMVRSFWGWIARASAEVGYTVS
ncbi:MAG: sarcosine oxidase subunit gamma [Ahrensia sp.]|nr:sarcosine oxidase subunit gamma [Ahrensia sp.]